MRLLLLSSLVTLLPCPRAQQSAVVPAAQRSVMGNTSTGVPLSSTPTRYQQVFLRSEMPLAFQMHCIGFRPDAAELYGRSVDLEMTLGLTSYDQTTITATFANNLNTGTPVNVIKRRFVRLPDLLPMTPQPNLFMAELAFDVPFNWVPAANLLLDITVWGNDKANSAFLYPLDAEAGPGTTTSRVLSFNGPSSPTGRVIPESGLVVRFGDRCTTAAYSTFGSGCRGTGNGGVVVPPRATSQWLGNSYKTAALLFFDERWQQLIDAAVLPAVPTFLATVAFRADEQAAKTAPFTVACTVRIGPTSTTSATMSLNYAINTTDPMSLAFQGNVIFPPTDGMNSDLGRFDFGIPLTAPFFYQPTLGKNLLVDIAFSSFVTTQVLIDLESGTQAPGAFVFGSPATAPTGFGVGPACLAIRFGIPATGTATPVLSAIGQPAIGASFDIALRSARGGTAAMLSFGGSNQTWGLFPLPLDLTPFGAPGCSLLASLDTAVAVATSPVGDGRFTLALPSNPALIGLRFYNQFLVADSQANRLGIAFSNGGAALIGEW